MAHYKLTEKRENGDTIRITQLFRDDELFIVGSYKDCLEALYKNMKDGDTFQEVAPKGLKSDLLNYDDINKERLADYNFRQGNLD